MPPSRLTTTSPGRLQSVLAWWLASVVFALGLLTVSPSLHEHLHAHDDDHSGHSHEHPVTAAAHDDAGCAVSLFQQGATAPLALPRVENPRARQISILSPAPGATPPAGPHHRLRPARGPPCIG